MLKKTDMKRKIVIGFAILLILAATQYKALLTAYASFYTIDNPTRGDNTAIVILSGGDATRIPKGLEIYKEGYGTRLLLTTERPRNSQVAQIFLSKMELAEEISKIVNIPAKFELVPSLKGGATSTFDEAIDLLSFCLQENIKHLIIVTDAFHSRRALYAFKKIFSNQSIKLEASAASNELFNEKNWWHSDVGISAYVLEPIKFAVYLFSNKNAPFVKNH